MGRTGPALALPPPGLLLLAGAAGAVVLLHAAAGAARAPLLLVAGGALAPGGRSLAPLRALAHPAAGRLGARGLALVHLLLPALLRLLLLLLLLALARAAGAAGAAPAPAEILAAGREGEQRGGEQAAS